MKKTFRKIISAVLALAMVLAVMSTSAFAATGGVKHYKAVTSLGDSIAVGFSMPDYATKSGDKFVLNKVPIDGSYPLLVSQAVGAERFHPLAQCGYRTVELRMALDPAYEGDIVAKRWQARLSNAPEYTYEYLRGQYPEYEEAIKDSDLVLLDIGFNDTWLTVLGTLVNIIEETPNTESTMETLDDAVEHLGSIENVFNYVMFKVQQTPSYIDSLSKALMNEVTLQEITENYDAIGKRIYVINPKTTIVAVSSFNPYRDWTDVPGLAQVTQKLLYDRINALKASYADPYGSQYIYVNAPDVEARTRKGMDALRGGWDPHPTEAGHQYIANQIIAALPRA